jgi:1,4-alpha-glucan branching enzyme
VIKSRLGDGVALVGFELPAAVSAGTASVCGDFNDWSPQAHPLTLAADGSFFGFVELPAGRRWQFRYLLDGERWENDWAADDYVGNGHGGEDSVVDLTDISSLPAAEFSPQQRGKRSAAAVQSPSASAEPDDGSAEASHRSDRAPAAGRGSGWFRRLIRRPA